MESTNLSCVEVEPEGVAERSVIWLHGLGADGHDFEPVVPWLGLDPGLRVRFVFPHAPPRPVTINAGLVMPAWYDIRVLALARDVDERGVRDSAARVAGLIDRERARGVDADRVVLAGFSQGGAIALHVGLRYPSRLAGIIALSTYAVCEDSIDSERSRANAQTPIFQAHGVGDPMVPLSDGERTHAMLRALGYAVEWRTYAMGHEVNPAELRDIGAALNRMLGPIEGGSAAS